jgi:LysM repeat protein
MRNDVYPVIDFYNTPDNTPVDMKSFPLLPWVIAPALLVHASCSVQSDEYDTPPPQTAPEASTETPPTSIYDSPAAYEHDTMSTPSGPAPGLPVDPGVPSSLPASQAAAPPTPTAVQATAMAHTITHTITKGDTLSGLSSKYRVPMDAIRRANGMTSDTVVLGKKMVIPQP